MKGYFNKEKYIEWRVQEDGDEGPILLEILNNTKDWINLMDDKYIGESNDTDTYRVRYREPTKMESNIAMILHIKENLSRDETYKTIPFIHVVIRKEWCIWK